MPEECGEACSVLGGQELPVAAEHRGWPGDLRRVQQNL